MPPREANGRATPAASDSIGLIIGDVSGKSLPAALLMALARTALYTAARTQPADPSAVLQAANSVLVGEMPRGSFVASSYVCFDQAAQTCALVNAAQPAPLLIRDGQALMLEGDGSHLPLGIVADPAYSTLTVALQPSDLLVFYTDGVIEAFDQARVLFGFERLEEVVCASAAATPQQVVEQIMAAVVRWMGDLPQHDDIALVAVRVTDEWASKG
jgi:serine phosphatase RsbU (regulator of sigma subunit)